ncbi:hypothetical protein Bhyg_10872 [Pseudolycoriella hygida]|uniref:Uncharacterized protein n=1 Tax=Pseudolycoriella hygida TaxID=35572 RepID=A0A9Q0MVY1_9DIPT|nr:hypothetical protein Bhyg_10872 [Pseudolycoriella hygida]
MAAEGKMSRLAQMQKRRPNMMHPKKEQKKKQFQRKQYEKNNLITKPEYKKDNKLNYLLRSTMTMTPPQVNNLNEFDHDTAFLCIIRNKKTVIGIGLYVIRWDEKL